MIATVILAAGYSTRMGEPKPLLKIDKKNFLEIILSNLHKLDLYAIYIVLGKQFDLIKNSVHVPENCYFLQNANPDQGQLSSLQIALHKIPNEVNGVLMVLVDHPLVTSQTYQKIFDAAHQKPDSIILPVYNKRRGHPVYFGRKYVQELMETPLEKGARFVVNNNSEAVMQLEVEDEAILMDIDTPEDYKKYVSEKQ
jgi:molybdenum cofactor cytidylyltransferase